MIVPPLWQLDIHDTLAVRKPTFATPPENGGRADGGRCKAEHFVLAAIEPERVKGSLE
jgi:hypothetical protein